MAIPSIFTPPVWPDFNACNNFYSSLNKPDTLDCHQALLMMLSGSNDRIWTIGRGIYGIPQIRTYGTCEIQVQASGPAAYYGQNFIFAPDQIRNMAGWVIDQCVFGGNMGGFMTAGIRNTTEYVARPDTFYEDPFPADTTFLNVVVWNSDRLYPDFNPGNMDPSTGMSIVGEIAMAYVEEPDDSVLKPNIARNFEFFQAAALAMGRTNFKTWWQGPGVSLTNNSAANLTESVNNFILAANITLPANSTFSGSNSTSLCAGAGNGITPGCSGQDNDLLTTS